MASSASHPPGLPHAVEVRAPARFHLGMFSFGDPRLRAFGGTGVMLDEPATVVRVRRAAAFGGSGACGARAVDFARACAASWRLSPAMAFHVEVVSAPPAHVGLGSGTQLALAVAAGVETLAGGPGPDGPGVGPEAALELVRATGRGRRSSVGAYGFALGGLVIEAGRLGADKVAAPAGVSPLVARALMPAEWRGVLVVERGVEGLHGDRERTAFEALAPVDRGLTAELARIALLELVPAALEGKFEAFAAAFGAYGRLAGVPFAAASRALPFHGSIERLLERVAAAGFPGAAQSSWGPALVVCCAGETEAAGLVATLAAEGLAATHEISIVRFARGGARRRVIG